MGNICIKPKHKLNTYSIDTYYIGNVQENTEHYKLQKFDDIIKSVHNVIKIAVLNGRYQCDIYGHGDEHIINSDEFANHFRQIGYTLVKFHKNDSIGFSHYNISWKPELTDTTEEAVVDSNKLKKKKKNM